MALVEFLGVADANHGRAWTLLQAPQGATEAMGPDGEEVVDLDILGDIGPDRLVLDGACSAFGKALC